jgi:hypothetical protein
MYYKHQYLCFGALHDGKKASMEQLVALRGTCYLCGVDTHILLDLCL